MGETIKYTWKDLICVGDKVYSEEHPISGEMDGENIYRIDSFFEHAAEKHHCNVDDIKTYTMDGESFAPESVLFRALYTKGELQFGAEDCGAYINGVPEWAM